MQADLSAIGAICMKRMPSCTMPWSSSPCTHCEGGMGMAVSLECDCSISATRRRRHAQYARLLDHCLRRPNQPAGLANAGHTSMQ